MRNEDKIHGSSHTKGQPGVAALDIPQGVLCFSNAPLRCQPLGCLAVSRTQAKLMLCLLTLLCPASLRAQDTSNEFWPEVDVFLKLNHKSRLFFLYSATKLDDRQTYSDGSFGGHFDFY